MKTGRDSDISSISSGGGGLVTSGEAKLTSKPADLESMHSTFTGSTTEVSTIDTSPTAIPYNPTRSNPYLKQVVHNISLWSWVAPVGGGANAEGDSHSGRYNLKKSVVTDLKFKLIEEKCQENKIDTTILGELKKLSQDVETEEKSIAKSVTEFNKQIADLNNEIKESKIVIRKKHIDDQIKFLENKISENTQQEEKDTEKKNISKSLPPNLKKEIELLAQLKQDKAQLEKTDEWEQIKTKQEKLNKLKKDKSFVENNLKGFIAQFNATTSELLKHSLKDLKSPIESELKKIDNLEKMVVFFKKEADVTKNIAEVFSGTLSRLLCPDALFAEVQFSTLEGKPAKGDGSDVYVASIGVPGFEDLFRDAYSAYNFNLVYEGLRDKLGFIPIPNKRPQNAGTFNKHPMHDIISIGRYQGLELFYVMALLLDDPDIHEACSRRKRMDPILSR